MTDHLLKWMKEHHVPVTRAKYLALAWGNEMPDPWTPEHEAELPEELQEVYGEYGDAQLDLFDKYNPDQPRDPAGGPSGGRWTSGGGSGVTAPIAGGDDKLLLVTHEPSHEQYDKWEIQIAEHEAGLEAEQRIGDREDGELYQMKHALKEYRTSPLDARDNDRIGLSVVYGGPREADDTRLLAATLVRFNQAQGIAQITLSGGLDVDAHEKSLHQIVARYGGKAERIEGAAFGDDLETIAIFERAGFRIRGEPDAGKVRLVYGKEGQTAAERRVAEYLAIVRKNEVEARARVAAAQVDFEPDQVKFTDEEKTFTLNGKQMFYAGSYTRGQPGVMIYHKHAEVAWVAGVVVHEIGHRKLDAFRARYRDEYQDMMAEPGPPPDPSGKHFWQWKGGHDAVMAADGTLRAPYDKKYPIYDFWARNVDANREQMHKDDGVTDYSKEYWKGYMKGTVGIDSAVHETIAEMARLKFESGGKLPGSRDWKKLYQKIDEVWKGMSPLERSLKRPSYEPSW